MTKEEYDIEVAKEYTTLQERIADLEKENAELNFKLKQAVKILKECAEYEDLTCYSDILEEIETFLKSVDNIII